MAPRKTKTTVATKEESRLEQFAKFIEVYDGALEKYTDAPLQNSSDREASEIAQENAQRVLRGIYNNAIKEREKAEIDLRTLEDNLSSESPQFSGGKVVINMANHILLQSAQSKLDKAESDLTQMNRMLNDRMINLQDIARSQEKYWEEDITGKSDLYSSAPATSTETMSSAVPIGYASIDITDVPKTSMTTTSESPSSTSTSIQGEQTLQNVYISKLYESLVTPNSTDKAEMMESLKTLAKAEKITPSTKEKMSKFEETLINHPKAFARMLDEFSRGNEQGESKVQSMNMETLFNSLTTAKGQLAFIECCETLNKRETEKGRGIKDFFREMGNAISNLAGKGLSVAPFKDAIEDARRISVSTASAQQSQEKDKFADKFSEKLSKAAPTGRER